MAELADALDSGSSESNFMQVQVLFPAPNENFRENGSFYFTLKKIVNNTPYPQHAIDAVARCLWPDIVAFFESEEGQKEFEAWKRQQDKENMGQENQLKAA